MPAFSPFVAILSLLCFASKYIGSNADFYDQNSVSTPLELNLSTAEENRIANGKRVYHLEMTSVVYLETTKVAGAIEGCTGSLLSIEYVVTAAHCAIDRDLPKGRHPPIAVTVDTVNPQVEGLGHKVHVKEIFVHPEYNSYTRVNDVAVLKLQKTLKPSDRREYMQLGSRDEPELDHTGKAMIYGWGLTGPNSPSSKFLLKAEKMNVVNIRACKIFYSIYYRFSKYNPKVTDANLCVRSGKRPRGEIKQQACKGDSGGPLVRDGKLIGIVSWGGRSCSEKRLAVFVKVSAVWDFINTHAELGLDDSGRKD